jgi:hypothetical protein
MWELTAAFIASYNMGNPSDHIFVVNSTDSNVSLKKFPIELQAAEYHLSEKTAITEIPLRLNRIKGIFQQVGPLMAPNCIGRSLTGIQRFTGRLAEMWTLHSKLNPPSDTLIASQFTEPKIVQVIGNTGMGKTVLVEEYALRFGAAYPGGIYWLEAHGSFNPRNPDIELFKAACKEQYLKILYAHDLKTPPDTPFEYIMAAAGRIIEEKQGRSLWIVDDLPYGLADHMDLVKQWFAPHPKACTLVTTRNREYSAVGQELLLEGLDEAEALELIESHKIDLNDQMDAALDLFKRLKGIPIAIGTASIQIAAYDGKITTYTEELDQNPNTD